MIFRFFFIKFKFPKHWPSGLMLSKSRDVCLSVCVVFFFCFFCKSPLAAAMPAGRDEEKKNA